MILYGYLRVSGQDQVGKDGPQRQRDAVRAFCRAHSLHQRGNFFEPAVSGTTEGADRPELSRLLSLLPAGGAIVVERLDRLARDLLVQELILKECRERGVKVFSTDQGQLIDMATNDCDPTRILIRQIIGALAQWERSMLVKKLRAARDRIRNAEGRCEGGSAYGDLNENEARILQLARDFHDAGDSLPQIADRLNEGGFVTRRGRPWRKSSVQTILSRRRCKEDKYTLNGPAFLKNHTPKK